MYGYSKTTYRDLVSSSNRRDDVIQINERLHKVRRDGLKSTVTRVVLFIFLECLGHVDHDPVAFFLWLMLRNAVVCF